MRICLVYDCLFPWTIGGAERWYRNLAERLAAAGHEVTYLTLRQWADDEPRMVGVDVVAVGPQMQLYRDGKRRILPPLRFGLGVFCHLLRNPRRYDWVHTASFPYFSLLAAGILRPISTYRIAVDWHEVWSRDYWREYLGALGWIGWAVQRLCARVPQFAYTFSNLYRGRIREAGLAGPVTVLTGEYAGGEHRARRSAQQPPTIVYAGRFIPEKRLILLADALAILMRRDASVRAILYGQGPDHQRVTDRVDELGLGDRIHLPGFVEAEELEDAMCAAAAIVQPSAREGYGMVVVEASARGVPVVVVAGEDNAAVELVEEGRNGFIAAAAEPELLADAIQSCISGGDALRVATRKWYQENKKRLSLSHSLEIVAANYALGIR